MININKEKKQIEQSYVIEKKIKKIQSPRILTKGMK